MTVTGIKCIVLSGFSKCALLHVSCGHEGRRGVATTKPKGNWERRKEKEKEKREWRKIG